MQTHSIFSFHFLSFPHHFQPTKPLQTLNPTKPFHLSLSRPIQVSNGPHEPNSKDAELELLGKPFPVPKEEGEEDAESSSNEPKGDVMEEALAPFLKFFKSDETATDSEDEGNGELGYVDDGTLKGGVLGTVEFYDPKPGDFVVGVVVSGNENKLDVNVGADMLGTMLTKEVLPLQDEEMAGFAFDLVKDAEELMVPGKIGAVRDEALDGGRVPGRSVVEVGAVVFAEVLGRTLSGRPLLSSRRLFRRVAWHRVRQIKQLNEPIEVRITQWNTGGLLARIEGLRAFLPKAELIKRVNNFTDLKENIDRRIRVCITRVDEENNDLIISEREAWEKLYLQEGTLLEGTVRKIFPFGAQVTIADSNRSGLLHISNITRARVESVEDLLKVDDKLKVLVVKSLFPEKISLSIADLESKPGLFIKDKEKVFCEAEAMAKMYRSKLPVIPAAHKLSPLENALPFDDEAKLYSNWKWFMFEREGIVDAS